MGAVVSTGSESRSAVLIRTDFFSLLPGPRGSAGACAAAYSRATASSLDLAGTNGVGVMIGWYAGAGGRRVGSVQHQPEGDSRWHG